jgi:small basic protein
LSRSADLLFSHMAVTLAFMGWFWGIDLYLATALMTICGGLLFQNTAG